ncbi:chemotaxis-specific protein-glutamate methyltransferase CheB [Sphingomonas sp. NFR15]|uniref:chemotaxis-specific protein-glutamate methyltransferase CheB n=1 Tax=Sphingomonas sp. NFR15 TaxID=1566282 RepID=UPI000892675C|nr:chemotaxis-specific protein-glutamate methyltransferase CheB [Sphingomonas sp. NFR15]SDA31686.1 two-component system, chemotaxis family, response regulator CheB [Sphingomonas sp. NFR15]
MTRVLIVDDSPLMRRLLGDIFASAGDFEVAVARSGAEALALLAAFAPDVITLDIHMPEMDGLACLDRIMLLRPCPVVMVSALTAEGANETLEAMALGAVDFIAKPRGAISLEIDALAPVLVDKVRAAAGARISRAARLTERVRARAGGTRQAPPASHPHAVRTRPVTRAAAPAGLVLVGCSTGGPPALDALLGGLAADFPWPVVVAQHMPASFTGALARRLDRICALDVIEVSGAVPLEPGRAYIGRGDADVIVSRRGGAVVAMSAPNDPARLWHPSVDRLVESAAAVLAPERLVGVLMTGMGNDGATAMADLHRRGGHTIAESAETAIVWGMPGALVAAGGAGETVPLERIAPTLTALFAA